MAPTQGWDVSRHKGQGHSSAGQRLSWYRIVATVSVEIGAFARQSPTGG